MVEFVKIALVAWGVLAVFDVSRSLLEIKSALETLNTTMKGDDA